MVVELPLAMAYAAYGRVFSNARGASGNSMDEKVVEGVVSI